jgi:TP901 family phage tail tape measure protein
MARREEVVIRVKIQDGVTRALRVIGDRLDKTGVSAGKASKGLGKTAIKGAAVAKLAGPIGFAVQAVLGLAAAAGTASAAFAALATRDFARFEQSVVNAAAVTKEGAENIGAFGQAAERAGMSSAFSATQAADALNFMSMAGMSATDSMKALPDVLALASAGSIDLAAAADIATNIMTGYGKTASDLAHVNDVLTGTFTNSNVSLQELGHAFKMVGPVAKASGQDFEQVSAAIGMLGNAGIKGTMAGRTLRTALINLQAPPAKARAALEQLGVAVFDTNGKMRAFSDILLDLQKAGAGTQALADIFGREAIAGVQALLDQGPERLAKFTGELKSMHGVAKDIERMKLDTVMGQFQIMSGALETLSATFGQQLGPIVKSIIQDFNNLLASGQFMSGSLATLKAFVAENGETMKAWAKGGIQFAAMVLDEIGVVIIRTVGALTWLARGFEDVMKALGLFVDSADSGRDAAENLRRTIALLHLALGAAVAVMNPLAGGLIMASSLLWKLGDGAEHAAQGMDRVATAQMYVDLYRYRKELGNLKTGFESLDKAIAGVGGSFDQLKKDGDKLFGAIGGIAGVYVDAFKQSAKEQEKTQKKELDRTQQIARLRTMQLFTEDKVEKALFGTKIAALEVLERGLEGYERALVLGRAQKAVEDARAEQARERLARLKKAREAREKSLELDRKAREEGAKVLERIMKEAEEEERSERRALARLEILQTIDEVRASEMERAEGMRRLEEDGITGHQLALAQYELEIEHKERLKDIEERRNDAAKRAAEERQKELQALGAEIRGMGGSLATLAAMQGPIGALGGAFAGISDIAGGLAENMDEIEKNTSKGIKAVASATAASGATIATFMDKMGASAAAQAGILALFEAAASAASFALGDVYGGVQHGIAAGLYGAAALAGGGSAPSASGATAPTGGAASSASAGGGTGPDFEDIARRNAEIQAEALAAALGGGAGGSTIILDLSGMVAPDQRTFDEMVTGAVMRGARAAGLNTQSLQVVGR